MNLLGCLAPKGVLVFYSAISGKPFVGPAQAFIFHDIAMRGFWLGNWFNSATSDKVTAMYDRLAPLVASGAVSAPVAGTFSFAQIPEAVAVAAKNRGIADYWVERRSSSGLSILAGATLESGLTGSSFALSTGGVPTRADISARDISAARRCSGPSSERGRATARAISICDAP